MDSKIFAANRTQMMLRVAYQSDQLSRPYFLHFDAYENILEKTKDFWMVILHCAHALPLLTQDFCRQLKSKSPDWDTNLRQSLHSTHGRKFVE